MTLKEIKEKLRVISNQLSVFCHEQASLSAIEESDLWDIGDLIVELEAEVGKQIND